MILEPEFLPKDINNEVFNVVYLDMDPAIPEQINQNPDGSYTVFLNARLSYASYLKSIDHAFDHVRNRDHQRCCSVQQIETERHNL